MFNVKALKNRLYNGGLATAATIPIYGLAAYKILDDLDLHKDIFKISRFTLGAALVTGIIWALLPASRRNPTQEDHEVLKEQYGSRYLLGMADRVQRQDNRELRRIHRRNNPEYYQEEDRKTYSYSDYRSREYDKYNKTVSTYTKRVDEVDTVGGLKSYSPFNRSSAVPIKKVSQDQYKTLTADDIAKLVEN